MTYVIRNEERFRIDHNPLTKEEQAAIASVQMNPAASLMRHYVQENGGPVNQTVLIDNFLSDFEGKKTTSYSAKTVLIKVEKFLSDHELPFTFRYKGYNPKLRRNSGGVKDKDKLWGFFRLKPFSQVGGKPVVVGNVIPMETNLYYGINRSITSTEVGELMCLDLGDDVRMVLNILLINDGSATKKQLEEGCQVGFDTIKIRMASLNRATRKARLPISFTTDGDWMFILPHQVH